MADQRIIQVKWKRLKEVALNTMIFKIFKEAFFTHKLSF